MGMTNNESTGQVSRDDFIKALVASGVNPEYTENVGREVRHARGRVFPVLNGAGVVTTEQGCPLCREMGRTTVGGEAPKLLHRADDSTKELFCMGTHGYLSAEELAS